MAYYCYLCNENHDDSLTEEHFIPRSIDGPEYQWLPVCEASNIRSNSVFDNKARDILYWVRFLKSGALKRSGEALLADGTLRQFKFSYFENSVSEESVAFRYIYDLEANAHIPCENVYAIALPVGLKMDERETFCRGIAKISIGALAYLLKKQGVEDQKIMEIFSQTSIDTIRHIALNLTGSGKPGVMRFLLGRSDVLLRLQNSCNNRQVQNHVIKIDFQKEHSIHIEGMLYSQYGWIIDLSNQIFIGKCEIRLENSINHMKVPESLIDKTLSPDTICILNPNFVGQSPNIPNNWRNS